jgi:photosystem II stability/assembly factor-like uncharacterized protein
MGIIIALYGLEWQKIPDVPVGRGDDIEIGYTQPPQERQIIYIADRFSWVYKSEDGGNTWDSLIPPPSYPPYSRKPLAVVCNKNNAYSVWIAKSERDDPEYKGVYFSWNGGWDWDPRNEGITNFKILCLTQAPDNPNFLFLGCEYVENTPNVFKTENGGMNWYALTPINRNIQAISVPSANSNVIYVAGGNSIYKSEDGGQTWNIVFGDPSTLITDIKVKPGNPNIAWAINYVDHLIYVESFILKTENGGATWDTVATIHNVYIPSFEILFDTYENVYCPIYASSLQHEIIFYTRDRGNTWNTIKREQGIYGGMPLKLKMDPRNSSFLILVGDGCIYKSENNGGTWKEINYTRTGKPEKFNIAKSQIISYSNSPSPILGIWEASCLMVYKRKVNEEKWVTIYSDGYYPPYKAGIHEDAFEPNRIFLIWDEGVYGFSGQYQPPIRIGAYTNDGGIHFFPSHADPFPPQTFIKQMKQFKTWPSPTSWSVNIPAPGPITFALGMGKSGQPHDAGKIFKTRNGSTW